MLTQHRKARMSPRRFTRRAATVSLGAEKSPVNCVIWDISEGGARLTVAHPLADLPHQFTLNLNFFKNGSAQRNCEIIWIDKRFVGVKFTEQA